MLNKPLLKHTIFWFGLLTAFWGAFEMAYDASCHPIWSGTWGAPWPHHYVVGFICIIISYFLSTKTDWMIGIETFINKAVELRTMVNERRK